MEFQGKGVGIPRKGKFKERLRNLHQCEFARNRICKERNEQRTELATNGGGKKGEICKEWTLQRMRMPIA